MSWVICQALSDWIKDYYLFGDSMISICWLTSEKLRLELFHRNRVLQIRRGTKLENVYYVKTNFNPADCGTRPDQVRLTDMGPNSKWECGAQWMNLEITEAVKKGFIKPASELRMTKELENEFKEGLVFGDRDEDFLGQTGISVNALNQTRVKKLTERTEFSKYLVNPTKYSFPSIVRIYGYIFKFIGNASKGRKMLGPLLRETELWFSVFPCKVGSVVMNPVQINLQSMPVDTNCGSPVSTYFIQKQLILNSNADAKPCLLSENSLHQALLYLFRKGTFEVKKFVSKQTLSKISHEVDGILLSKNRLIEGMNFVETGELGQLNIGSLGVKVNAPILDRYSPLSYSISQHIHWHVSNHRGIETTNRLMLEHVFVIQGMSLCKELADECIRCHMKRKKLLEVPMGPISQDQLVLAPPFHVTMLDLCGPMRAYVPGFERETRNRRAIDYKLYIMVCVCVTTKIINLQVLEGKSADSIIEGFSRLCAEVGVPNMVHVDLDSGALAGFQGVEFEFRDLQSRLWTQYGISFSTCPKGGHDQHGLVERAIKSIKETFLDAGLDKKRIHSLGWQTFAKIAENAYNNIPIGYSYSRSHDNTDLLKIITPNMLRVGRINSRALQGPIRLPTSKREILKHVENLYQGWFRIFKDAVVPKLINQPKWFRIEEHLSESDLVYFQKDEGDISGSWTLGQVDQLVVSRDGFIRRAIIKYFNAGEDRPQFSDRSVRKLVKLWSIEESSLFEDLKEVDKRVTGVGSTEAVGVTANHVLHGVLISGHSGSLSGAAVFTTVGERSVKASFDVVSCSLESMKIEDVFSDGCYVQNCCEDEEEVNDLSTLAGIIRSTDVLL